MLSDSGSSSERNRLQINTAKGSVLNYIDRTIRVLDSLVLTVISWPLVAKRRAKQQELEEAGELFSKAIGFLNGLEIVLRLKP